QSDEPSDDGSGACPSVGLEDVAIDGDRALAQGAEVEGASQRTTDEALDLLGATARRLDPPLTRFSARRAGPRVHLVLGREPAAALASQELKNHRIHRNNAQHHRVARPIKHRAVRGPVKANRDLYRAMSGGRSTIGAHESDL